MAFIEQRNRNLRGNFRKIAVHYMRHGEQLGIRWDLAFYQMLVETNYLTFKRGNGSFGDVRADQNNFAGLGATGGGEPGESFNSVSDGVRAHLEHIVLYATGNVDNPIADRTRKVQQWGILDSWRDGFGRPLRFSDLTTKWSPGDSGYSDDIKVTEDRFKNNFCNKADPKPDLLAEARTGLTTGERLARNAISRGKADSGNGRSGLGAQASASAFAVPFKVVNAATGRQSAGNAGNASAFSQRSSAGPRQQDFTQTASAAGALLPKAGKAPGRAGNNLKCHVFTASYGGQKAVIVKALKGGVINYTVLDVNKGNEKRETEAYIAAYAKGGSTVGEYGSQNQALDRAFQLCPEG